MSTWTHPTLPGGRPLTIAETNASRLAVIMARTGQSDITSAARNLADRVSLRENLLARAARRRQKVGAYA